MGEVDASPVEEEALPCVGDLVGAETSVAEPPVAAAPSPVAASEGGVETLSYNVGEVEGATQVGAPVASTAVVAVAAVVVAEGVFRSVVADAFVGVEVEQFQLYLQ